jgi:hypothetical protein
MTEEELVQAVETRFVRDVADGLIALMDERDALRAENARLREAQNATTQLMSARGTNRDYWEATAHKLETENARLREALAPLKIIADRYDDNGLDEARPSWGACVPSKVEIVQGRGGARLLTLQQCLDARAALDPSGQKERRAKALSELAEVDADLLDIDPEMKS